MFNSQFNIMYRIIVKMYTSRSHVN